MSGADFKLQCVEVALKYFQVNAEAALTKESLFELADEIEKYCNEFVGNK